MKFDARPKKSIRRPSASLPPSLSSVRVHVRPLVRANKNWPVYSPQSSCSAPPATAPRTRRRGPARAPPRPASPRKCSISYQIPLPPPPPQGDFPSHYNAPDYRVAADRDETRGAFQLPVPTTTRSQAAVTPSTKMGDATSLLKIGGPYGRWGEAKLLSNQKTE